MSNSLKQDCPWQDKFHSNLAIVFANDKHLLSPGNLSEVDDQSSKQG